MKKIGSFFCAALLFFAMQGEAAFTVKNGKIVNLDEVAEFSVDEHYSKGMAALQQNDFREAARQLHITSSNFADLPKGQEAYYFLGISYYKLEEYELANTAFSQYLKCHKEPEFFEEAVTYKFAIANQFKCGAKKRFFGWKQMPKWLPCPSYALELYDEVIAAMPCHSIAAEAMYAKARFLWEQYDFEESIEVFQQLIRRFPKNELTPQSYFSISKIYLEQSQFDIQNPDLLALSLINLRKFKQEFPREELVNEVEEDVQEIKELFATQLFKTGLFYERIDKPNASLVYYKSAIEQFPDTAIARRCHSRAQWLEKNLSLFAIPGASSDAS